MVSGIEKTSRKPRSDSVRNREKLLDAATRIFSAGGSQASLEAVAREAGVGIGTLYRHFPTRESLFEAVYRHEVDHLSELAAELAREADPVDALRRWLHANVRLVATKKGMISALQEAAQASNELRAYSLERLTDAIGLLLGRGIASGELRDDISPDELLRTLLGIFYSQGPADWQPGALRLVDVFVDGLRTRQVMDS
ncbi:MAG: TetR/AcrR family transcriptional regulator [Rhizobiaceae bacterium]|nr:TetR/AcrR family transcriptional regulator [Rhizobiaceae bacterium]